MKYLKRYSCNGVTFHALFIFIHFKLKNAKIFFIEFREEKLSQQVSKFTKVFPQQSFSTLSLFIVSELK